MIKGNISTGKLFRQVEMSTFRSCKTNSTASLGLFLSAALTIAIACGMAWKSNNNMKTSSRKCFRNNEVIPLS